MSFFRLILIQFYLDILPNFRLFYYQSPILQILTYADRLDLQQLNYSWHLFQEVQNYMVTKRFPNIYIA